MYIPSRSVNRVIPICFTIFWLLGNFLFVSKVGTQLSQEPSRGGELCNLYCINIREIIVAIRLINGEYIDKVALLTHVPNSESIYFDIFAGTLNTS